MSSLTGRTFLAAFTAFVAVAAAPVAQAPLVRGLDHVPIAVRDLEAAARTYQSLGFALKPGRPHDNGIRNQHVKFKDGTELELITAPQAKDALTAKYRKHLEAGDGPAFLALFAPEAKWKPRERDAALDYMFFGPRNESPTDRPEHFAHANGADSLISVWLAAPDFSPERRLLTDVGIPTARGEVRVPDAVSAEVARFEEGDLILLPGSRQMVPGRRIVGATVRVKNAAIARASISAAVAKDRMVASGGSIFVRPEAAHGLWLEFRPASGKGGQ